MSTWLKRSSAAIATAAALSITGTAAHALPSAPETAPKHATNAKKPILMGYQVREGDTLWEISKRTGVTVAQLISANNLRSDGFIRAGQRLTIPTTAAKPASQSKPAAAPKPASSKGSTYTVKSGDNLSSIAARYKTTVGAIASANNISNPSRIYVGQKLTIPGSSASSATPAKAAPAPAKKAAPATSSTTYTVKAGDNLSSIAARHKTTVAAIASANNISNPSRIHVGQKLTIGGSASTTKAAPAPAKKATPAPKAATSKSITYTVKSGDTLSGIAARHNTTVTAIVTANKLPNANVLRVGQKLVIGGSASSSAPAKEQLVTNNFPGYTYADEVVSAANENKHALNAKSVPSRAQMQRIIRDTAVQMGVDPRLALAHAYVESGFDATAVSPANAVGVMQVIPSSGQWASQMVGRQLDLLDPYDNVVAGIAIIRSLHNSADNFDQAVAGYYQGLGGVKRYGMRPDTVNYVAKIKSAMNRF